MAKYKICPVCGEHNKPVMLECLKCEADLSGTRVIDENTEKAQNSQNKIEKKSVITRMIRVCDCGYKNSVQNRKCVSCGEDISMVIPTPDSKEETEEIKYILSSIEGDYTYELSQPITIVGRENEMKDYLANKTYVSRKHAEFRIEDNKLFIVNYSHTNYTFINNNKIGDENPKELKDGDEIGLGGNSQNNQRQNDAAYFVIRIGACS